VFSLAWFSILLFQTANNEGRNLFILRALLEAAWTLLSS
jgi:hypothetical protein